MKGLIIKEPWIDLILEGKKIWEIRGTNTKIRGTIALIKGGSGCIFGTVELIDSKQLMEEEFCISREMHYINKCELPYSKTFAWVLTNPVIFNSPKPYKHPNGAVIWVNLNDQEDSGI